MLDDRRTLRRLHRGESVKVRVAQEDGGSRWHKATVDNEEAMSTSKDAISRAVHTAYTRRYMVEFHDSEVQLVHDKKKHTFHRDSLWVLGDDDRNYCARQQQHGFGGGPVGGGGGVVGLVATPRHEGVKTFLVVVVLAPVVVVVPVVVATAPDLYPSVPWTDASSILTTPTTSSSPATAGGSGRVGGKVVSVQGRRGGR
jgi:hypothetical protein